MPDQLSVKERRRVVAYALKLEQAFSCDVVPQRSCERPVMPETNVFHASRQGRVPGPYRLLEVFHVDLCFVH